MNAIIWKELRENALWAALGFIALLLSFAYVIDTQYHGGSLLSGNSGSAFSKSQSSL